MTRPEKLSHEDIATRMLDVPGWDRESKELRRTFTFADFPAAVAFVNRLEPLAESAGHHPDIDIRYNRVILNLTTHDAGGLTENDFAMAAAINLL